MSGEHTYNKTEKLKSRKQLSALFAGGKAVAAFPIKLFYMPAPASEKQLVRAGVGVSTRNFKKAVDRNRIKRLLRESYRLEKAVIHAQVAVSKQPILIFFLYLDKTLPDVVSLREKMNKVLQKLAKELHEIHAANH